MSAGSASADVAAASSGAPLTSATIAERLLYRDGLMLVLDKPAGIAVHRGPKGGEALDALFDGLRFGLPRNPALAHRLDRDTSGCLVLGRHHKALEKLGLLFKQSRIEKTYWAVVVGDPATDAGLIDLPLARLDKQRGWWMKVDADGLSSQTRWRVMARRDGLCAVALEPLTGRTHQLRVHCAAMGWPILGDPIYGRGGDRAHGSPPLQLHARAIRVPLYKARDEVAVEAPVPAHMAPVLASLGLRPTGAEGRLCCDTGGDPPAPAGR